MLVAGIMSGTSLDGIDVAIVETNGRRVETLAFATTRYPPPLRFLLLDLAEPNRRSGSAGVISELNFALGEAFAQAVMETCKRAKLPLQKLKLIGSHGQTIYHHSGSNTLQIGEAAVIAERTGIPVVSNFRARDIAAGGKGAPLVPFVDALLFPRGSVALNIGGIANITALGQDGSAAAFDTGPGNMVIDALVSEHTSSASTYDKDGKLAAQGEVDTKLLDSRLKDSYYRLPPPKSAGREQYGEVFLKKLKKAKLPMLDLIATATAFTAATIAVGIQRFAPPAKRLIVSGGGLHNPRIMAHLAAFLPELKIETSADYGIDPDAKEAIAFAILAHETWNRRPSNLPAATGARRAVILGDITPAP